LSGINRSVEQCLEALAASFCDVLEWKWDGRFGTALAEFPTDRRDEILHILGEQLANSWDSTNLKEAPALAQAVGKWLGGIMPGQRLLIRAFDEWSCVFCAWWPWGNGTKISIRIAPLCEGLNDEQRSSLMTSFRDGFKV